MKKENIEKMVALAKKIEELNAELNALKDECRAEANGDTANWTCYAGSVTVSKPGKESQVEKWDMVKFSIECPATYKKYAERYCSVTVKAGRAASVTVKVSK